jgi:hypothetical protein
LNKIISILENHSGSLSFSLSLHEKREIEKKRETKNDSLECHYIYSKSPGSGNMRWDVVVPKYFKLGYKKQKQQLLAAEKWSWM